MHRLDANLQHYDNVYTTTPTTPAVAVYYRISVAILTVRFLYYHPAS